MRLLTVGEPRADGMRTVFFELNGQPREVEVRDKSLKQESRPPQSRSAKPGRSGRAYSWRGDAVARRSGRTGEKGDRLLVLEAMKMQTTIHAPIDGTVKEIAVKVRQAVEAHDLLVTIE